MQICNHYATNFMQEEITGVIFFQTTPLKLNGSYLLQKLLIFNRTSLYKEWPPKISSTITVH